MQIEAQIEMENNDGNIITLDIVAEYEPFERAATGDYGMPTETDTDEVCDIITVNGIAEERMFLAFKIAYSYRDWLNKLTAAVREAFEADSRVYGF
jgi:hypothetical protein